VRAKRVQGWWEMSIRLSAPLPLSTKISANEMSRCASVGSVMGGLDGLAAPAVRAVVDGPATWLKSNARGRISSASSSVTPLRLAWPLPPAVRAVFAARLEGAAAAT
jgi:hypothetical protein